jgi:ATP-dependent DNA ligase
VGKLLDYAGASSRLAPDRGLALPGDRWGWQPKLDGVYARATTDAAGRIVELRHRSGEAIPLADCDGLPGLATGLPNATLHGELEAGTECGRRSAALRGYPVLHLFDISLAAGRSLARLPYLDRYQALHRWQADVEELGRISRGDWWEVDATGRAHDPATGRYCRAVPRDLRRLPIVELARGVGAGQRLWREHVDREGGEGIVAVRLDAQLGARDSKRKIKATDTLDCVVVEVRGRVARVAYAGRAFSLRVGVTPMRVGETVEVAHDGWYEAAPTPRFARLVRRRPDLGPV